MSHTSTNTKEMTEEKYPAYDKNATMRGRTMVLVGIVAAIVAIVMYIFRAEATIGRIVVVGGVLFVGAGAFNLLFFNNGSGFNRALTSLTNAAAIVLGVCMLVFRGTFEPMIPFIFGLIVALCALWQFYALAIGIRPFTLPAWYYFFPLAVAAMSVYIFVRRDSIDSMTIFVVTAVAIGIFGAGTIIEGLHTGVLHRRAEPETEDESADLDEPIGKDALKQHEATRKPAPVQPAASASDTEPADNAGEEKEQ